MLDVGCSVLAALCLCASALRLVNRCKQSPTPFSAGAGLLKSGWVGQARAAAGWFRHVSAGPAARLLPARNCMKIIDVPQVGKLGLTVTWPGRYGLTRRQWVSPANPRTPAQLAVRSRITLIASQWLQLTEAQQNAWNAAASAVSSKPSLGQSGPLTGYQLFAKQNATLAELGQDPVVVPSPRPVFEALAPQALVISNNAGVIALKLTCPSDPGDGTVVRASKPQNDGTRMPRSLRFLGTCPAPAQGASDITALYSAVYGVPAVKQRIFVECQLAVDGWLGPVVRYSALVPAAT
jgi:hypothetical protein